MSPLSLPVEELEISVGLARVIEELGVKTLGDLLAVPLIRASAPIVAELAALFDDRGVEYAGALEALPYLIPDDRRVPVRHVSYLEGGPPNATTRMGGAPSSWSLAAAAEWPKCERCARPLRFVGQIVGPLALEHLALAEGEAVQVFACLDESSNCPSWEPQGPASAAFVRAVGDQPAKSVAAPFAAFAVETTPAFDDALLRDEDAVDEPEWHDAFTHGQHDKLGGIACAGNDPELPTCAQCNHPMELLAQLASDAVPSPFADGTMFVYVCRNKHSACVQYVR